MPHLNAGVLWMGCGAKSRSTLILRSFSECSQSVIQYCRKEETLKRPSSIRSAPDNQNLSSPLLGKRNEICLRPGKIHIRPLLDWKRGKKRLSLRVLGFCGEFGTLSGTDVSPRAPSQTHHIRPGDAYLSLMTCLKFLCIFTHLWGIC